MNVFEELAELIKDQPDTEIVEISVPYAKRMLESAKAMNEKADIVRDFYQVKYENKQKGK